ncbi:hypothetical protein AKO1_013521 [Acrasis kona]|uniref:C2H2-type domain-containing protein n=1 Tax=Acrasis kona TaxID=1008807 RepID=A0AAW2ZG92_9EUKA
MNKLFTSNNMRSSYQLHCGVTEEPLIRIKDTTKVRNQHECKCHQEPCVLMCECGPCSYTTASKHMRLTNHCFIKEDSPTINTPQSQGLPSKRKRSSSPTRERKIRLCEEEHPLESSQEPSQFESPTSQNSHCLTLECCDINYGFGLPLDFAHETLSPQTESISWSPISFPFLDDWVGDDFVTKYCTSQCILETEILDPFKSILE